MSHWEILGIKFISIYFHEITKESMTNLIIKTFVYIGPEFHVVLFAFASFDNLAVSGNIKNKISSSFIIFDGIVIGEYSIIIHIVRGVRLHVFVCKNNGIGCGKSLKT